MGSFAVFILTHGRPDKVKTYANLRRCGYTGKIYLLVDDLDKTKEAYVKKYGGEVIIFDKKKIGETFDKADNFGNMKCIVYARNACFEEAKKLGLKNFLQLDDDYNSFDYRFDHNLKYSRKTILIKNLDRVFKATVKFLNSTSASSVAWAQGGDFIGGYKSQNAGRIQLTRKCMNMFFCSTEKPFQFLGTINEDVNVYTRAASVGALFFTMNQTSIVQTTTQSSSGGMTELYLDSGTYVKSFYTVMMQPSSVVVKLMQSNHKRLHHSVNWANTVPKIIREENKI